MTNLYHVIKDPVHGTMQFTVGDYDWIKPFIDTPNFQRLRHIKQMGLGDYIFPGAVHTRFNHSLGCCYVGSQIAHKIGLADEERQLVIIANLLHDIGHGPFSHAFEGIFHKIIRHESWTPYFLEDYRTEAFFQHYNHVNPRHHFNEQKFQEVTDMIMHKPKYKNVMADIVSSQLDADRLDYLLRDNHFCGARYGEFDIRWMLHCMAIVDSGNGERLGITHKGVGVVEHYLMARRLMVRNIYQSQKKLASEMLLIQLFASLAKDLEDIPEFASIHGSGLGQFLIAANQYNQAIANTTNVEQLKQNFLRDNYTNYKELCDYDVFALIKQLAQSHVKHPAVQIASRLHTRTIPKIYRLDNADLSRIEAEVQDFKRAHRGDFQDWQITFVRTPHQAYNDSEDPILVVDENGIRPISEWSYLIDTISNKMEHIDFLSIDKAISNDPRVESLMQSFQAIPAAV